MPAILRSVLFGLIALYCLTLDGCAATAPNISIPPTEPSSAYLNRVHPRVVLVLGSGAARGFAHAGVLKVLEENHIPIDMIIGTSAGSIVGALYADNPNAASLQQLLLNSPRKDVIDFSVDLPHGLVSGNALQNFLVTHLHARNFNQLRIPFIAIATDLGSGQMHAFSSGPIAPAVNASSALPPLFRPVILYGRTYVDGGLIDPIAVDVAERFHPQVIIAVSLNFRLDRTMPTYSTSVFLRSIDIMSMHLNELSANKAQVIIRPEPEDIGTFDGSKRAYLMKMGEDAARKALPEIKRLLKA